VDQTDAYWSVDGTYTSLRGSKEPRRCLLVIIGMHLDGTNLGISGIFFCG